MKQVWLITGSSRGIGRHLAEAVLENGHQLVATARNIDTLSDLKVKHAQNVILVPLDVTDEIAAANAVNSALEHFGRLDVLVNNAGYGNVNSIEDTSLADFRAEIETNLFGTIIMTKAVIPFMRVQGSGHIIQFSSVGGRMGPAGRAPYAAAKWGVEGFSEVLSKEMEPLGVKVTIIEPGGFRTDFAGLSTNLKEGRREYDATVGMTARFQRDYNGKQPGDPVRAAKAIIEIAGLDTPPLRLLLGSDALTHVQRNDMAKMAADKHWSELSVSTDFLSEDTK
jgi:NAD(P)-dependent dehydrogenase (short-subunit alcohol dehydrogenase family)